MLKNLRLTFLYFAIVLVLFAGVAQADSTLDKIKSSGTITLAYRESSVPFSYLDDKGKPTGFGWEICNMIANKAKTQLGLKSLDIKTQAVTSQNRIPLLQNGTVDIECGSTTNNKTRGEQVQFATNYFYTGTRFLVKSSSPVKSLPDLKGKTLVITTGTTNYEIVRNLIAEKNLGINLIGAKDHNDAFLMVAEGKADAFGMDDILLYGLKAAAKNPQDFKVVGEAIQVEPYGIMIRKNDPEFQKLVNGVLADIIKSGTFTKLYTKWFMSPIPPNGIALKAPMSKDLKANLTALSDKPAN